MTEREIHSQDLDETRGLAEDGSKVFSKIDGETIKFDSNGKMVAQVPTTTLASADPTVAGKVDGDEWFVLTNSVITKQWFWNAATTSWFSRPAGSAGGSSTILWTDVTVDPAATGNTATGGKLLPRYENNTTTGNKWLIDSNGVAVLVQKGTIITSFKPQSENNPGVWTDAQANSLANVADAVLLSNGERVKYGKYTMTGHGFTPIGANLFLSKSLAGTVTTTNPIDGDVHQKIGFVHDASTIEFLVQEAFTQGSTASTINSNIGSTSALVGRGVDVQLDHLLFRLAATGNASLQVATVSGTADLRGHTNYIFGSGSPASQAADYVSFTATTTPTYLRSAASLSVAGDVQIGHVLDRTTFKAYRVTMLINDGYVNNNITIERI